MNLMEGEKEYYRYNLYSSNAWISEEVLLTSHSTMIPLYWIKQSKLKDVIKVEDGDSKFQDSNLTKDGDGEIEDNIYWDMGICRSFNVNTQSYLPKWRE